MNLDGSDPLIWTPSAIDAELKRILAVMDSVNVDVSNAQKAGKISGDEWNTWYAEYSAAHDFLTNASDWWGSNVETARQHEQEAAKWRALVQSRGQQVQGPANLIRPDPSAPSSGIGWTTLLLIGGGLAIGTWGIFALKNLKKRITP